MKTLSIIIVISIIFLSCEKNDKNNSFIINDTINNDTIRVFIKDNFLLIGDTTFCKYTNSLTIDIIGVKNARVYDSIDIDSNSLFDFIFQLYYWYNDCLDFVCDTPNICDCWPTTDIYKGFINQSQFQVAYDFDSLYPLRFFDFDTISNNNIWLIKEYNCLQDYAYGFRSYDYGNWAELKNGYLGIRIIYGNDTCYGWIYIENTPTNLKVNEMAIQKKY